MIRTSPVRDERHASLPIPSTWTINGPVFKACVMIAVHIGVVCRAARRDTL